LNGAARLQNLQLVANPANTENNYNARSSAERTRDLVES
jgi:hypothetical protein